jgi:glycolate oxidase FAD binding subunit
VDLIHPRSVTDVAEALGQASRHGRRVLVVGGRTHVDKGNPSEVDAELWTTQLDQVVAYDPAEMLVVVQAGMRCTALAELLAEHGQEWPADSPPDSTVGGVIASGSSCARRLRVGPIRDTVVEMELVTGDGRTVHSGARTVKNVTGYDLHRLATGSLGTLGVITQLALKVRPLPQRSLTLTTPGDLALATAIVAEAPLVTGALATPDRVEVRLEGWADEVDELAAMVRRLAPDTETASDDGGPFPFPSAPWWTWPVNGTIVEAALVPSKLGPALAGLEEYSALATVGLAWIAASTDEVLAEIRAKIERAGGIAPAIRGPGGLGAAAIAAPDVHRRLRASFDPADILAPGRSWARETRGPATPAGDRSPSG